MGARERDDQFSLKRERHLVPEAIRTEMGTGVGDRVDGQEGVMHDSWFSPVNQKARLPGERPLRQGCRLQESREGTTQTGREKKLTRGT